VVDQGQSTVLQWSSSGTTECQASGGWSGSRPTSGNTTVGPISQQTTYSLSCSGSGGSAMAMISVSVNGTVTLSWQPPALREDGTPLDGSLGGYRVYYGSISRNYTDSIRINDPQVTQQSFQLPSGLYYFAMTAVDRDGLESDYSNEVTRRVN
jgi:fibronectin type 3 domain-containing protein